MGLLLINSVVVCNPLCLLWVVCVFNVGGRFAV